jgi:uncharacterized zinc-type alcohol dehydrogenase-like protein
MSLLKPNGVLVMVGLPEKPLQVHGLPVVSRQLKIAGSLVASRYDNIKMLDFAARHQIKPKIEEYEMVSPAITIVIIMHLNQNHSLFLCEY